MNQRDKLSDLLDTAFVKSDDNYGMPNLNQVTDYLLNNGVIVPPCKVGDPVYQIIFQKRGIPSHILQETCVGFHMINAPDLRGLDRKSYIIVHNSETNTIGHINFDKIGKTVFFTCEEAKHMIEE